MTDIEALNVEAREMSWQLINGNRADVRKFIRSHETPAKLVLAMVRHLGSIESSESGGDFAAYLHATVNLQSLLEGESL